LLPKEGGEIVMVTATEQIFARSSTRAYDGTAVQSPGIILDLMRAAVRAPTALKQQAWSFAVIQDKDLLFRFEQLAAPLIGHTFSRFPEDAPQLTSVSEIASLQPLFHGATTLIVIGFEKSGAFVEGECWLAAQNLMLAAADLGLGSCVIGSAISALNHSSGQKLLGLPPSFQSVVPIVLGNPAGPKMSTARDEPHVVRWAHPSSACLPLPIIVA
jgi:nitroreductase